jgi:hypothetical protein
LNFKKIDRFHLTQPHTCFNIFLKQ